MVASMGSEYVDYQPIDDDNNGYGNEPDNQPLPPVNNRPSGSPDFDY